MAKETKVPGATSKAPTPTPEDGYDWGQEAVTGLEMTKAEDLGIPFISICQDGSAEFKTSHKDHETKKIKDIKPGALFNTLTRQILYAHGEQGKCLKFIPCAHQKLWQEWRKKGDGGGFIKSHDTAAILAQCQRNAKKEDELANGNIIKTTSYFYGFAQNPDGTWVRAVIAMTSTQLKTARAWLNIITSLKSNGKVLPMFSHIYHLTTVVQTNDEGSWYGWKVETGKMLTREDLGLIEESRAVAKQMTEERLMLAPPAEEEGEPTRRGDHPY